MSTLESRKTYFVIQLYNNDAELLRNFLEISEKNNNFKYIMASKRYFNKLTTGFTFAQNILRILEFLVFQLEERKMRSDALTEQTDTKSVLIMDGFSCQKSVQIKMTYVGFIS
jgi:hypothetical protein